MDMADVHAESQHKSVLDPHSDSEANIRFLLELRERAGSLLEQADHIVSHERLFAMAESSVEKLQDMSEEVLYPTDPAFPTSRTSLHFCHDHAEEVTTSDLTHLFGVWARST